MKLHLPLILLLCVLSIGAYSTYSYFTSWKWQFKQSPSLVLYSIRPGMLPIDSPLIKSRIPKVREGVLDRVVVSSPAEKEQLLEATEEALKSNPKSYFASCFNPRHAVSTTDQKTVVLLCFECGYAKIITPKGTHTVAINRNARPLFISLIHRYNLKTDESDK